MFYEYIYRKYSIEQNKLFFIRIEQKLGLLYREVKKWSEMPDNYQLTNNFDRKQLFQIPKIRNYVDHQLIIINYMCSI